MFFAAFSFLVVKSTWISIVCLLLAQHRRAFVRWFMRTLLDRYRAGERGKVWDEIRERGADTQSAPIDVRPEHQRFSVDR